MAPAQPPENWGTPLGRSRGQGWTRAERLDDALPERYSDHEEIFLKDIFQWTHNAEPVGNPISSRALFRKDPGPVSVVPEAQLTSPKTPLPEVQHWDVPGGPTLDSDNTHYMLTPVSHTPTHLPVNHSQAPPSAPKQDAGAAVQILPSSHWKSPQPAPSVTQPPATQLKPHGPTTPAYAMAAGAKGPGIIKPGAPSKKAAGKLTAAGKGVAMKSKFKGVTWHSYNRRWRSSLPISNNPSPHIRYASTELEAARDYDELVIAIKGPEEFTNFQRDTYPDKEVLEEKWRKFVEGKRGQIGEKPEQHERTIKADIKINDASAENDSRAPEDDSKDDSPRSSTGKPPAVGTGSSRSPRTAKSKRRFAFDEVSNWEGDVEWETWQGVCEKSLVATPEGCPLLPEELWQQISSLMTTKEWTMASGACKALQNLQPKQLKVDNYGSSVSALTWLTKHWREAESIEIDISSDAEDLTLVIPPLPHLEWVYIDSYETLSLVIVDVEVFAASILRLTVGALPIKGLDRSDADDAKLWDGLGELVVLPSLKVCSYQTHSAPDNKPQHLGYFKNKERAARRYDELVLALRGPEAPTNFPRSTYPGKAALFKKWSSFIKEKIRKDAAREDSKQAPRKRQRGEVPPEPAISAAGRPVTGGLVLERAPRSPPRDPSAVASRSLRPRRAAALKRSRYSIEDGSDSEEGSVGQCRAVRQRLGV
ncbi:hypothetical protein COCSUDRAFT_43619 [Coccomyxa subellipsoidea C-169]|uniref:AP2/ERF domain-containing protein n=1 Tax=Coccomyxa subellipsoidea (strain C-169) TaxID=574566 RepID=I0YQK4_COCSC|nr:hypothetical protein COCSUDRAFT_43619 [Coccomyxa subellipsoidea C-169]EIE20673.1 hypothetical protein COCSUDRAFT_43619 [Coccomyxa subellipsoidea C-169]|eukprot:XP_005645217.1 hypothetical protein COCSUDRAFT_43619 [Coccomyxa subellipsoidea C-169]